MDLAPIWPDIALRPETLPPRDAVDAAQQFEALLLGQMLENMHVAEDSESGALWSVAAQQFAQVLSRNGGLGLTKVIAAGLERKP